MIQNYMEQTDWTQEVQAGPRSSSAPMQPMLPQQEMQIRPWFPQEPQASQPSASPEPAGLDMSCPMMSCQHSPTTNAEAYQGSLKSLLSRNVGYFIVATFLIGSEDTVVWQGILHTVGNDYLVIYQPDYNRYISADLYSLKFVEFHNTQSIPYFAGMNQWSGSKT